MHLTVSIHGLPLNDGVSTLDISYFQEIYHKIYFPFYCIDARPLLNSAIQACFSVSNSSIFANKLTGNKKTSDSYPGLGDCSILADRFIYFGPSVLTAVSRESTSMSLTMSSGVGSCLLILSTPSRLTTIST